VLDFRRKKRRHLIAFWRLQIKPLSGRIYSWDIDDRQYSIAIDMEFPASI
jgi:hypothetical protein